MANNPFGADCLTTDDLRRAAWGLQEQVNDIVVGPGTEYFAGAALEFNGTTPTQFDVKVDNVTIIVNGSNELEVVGGGGGTTYYAGDALELVGAGTDTFNVKVDGVTVVINGSNELEAVGGGGAYTGANICEARLDADLLLTDSTATVNLVRYAGDPAELPASTFTVNNVADYLFQLEYPTDPPRYLFSSNEGATVTAVQYTTGWYIFSIQEPLRRPV